MFTEVKEGWSLKSRRHQKIKSGMVFNNSKGIAWSFAVTFFTMLAETNFK